MCACVCSCLWVWMLAWKFYVNCVEVIEMLVCFCVGQLAFTDSLTFSCYHWNTGITHTCFYTWLYMNYKDLDSGSHIKWQMLYH